MAERSAVVGSGLKPWFLAFGLILQTGYWEGNYRGM